MTEDKIEFSFPELYELTRLKETTNTVYEALETIRDPNTSDYLMLYERIYTHHDAEKTVKREIEFARAFNDPTLVVTGNEVYAVSVYDSPICANTSNILEFKLFHDRTNAENFGKKAVSNYPSAKYSVIACEVH